MKSKVHWIIFILSMLTLVPIKLYSSIVGTGFEKSIIFFSLNAITLGAFFLFSFLSKDKISCFRSVKNPYIGIISLIASGVFIWNAMGLVSPSPDTFFQNLLMLVFSIASAVTFLFIALNYFLGRNMFTKAQILIFFPTLWFIIKMVSFLSISDDMPDQYDVSLNAFMLLFLLNHTQLFVTSTDKNITKRLFMSGLPAVACSVMFCVPEIIHQMQTTETINHLELSTLVTQLVLGVYTCFVLIDIQKQIDLNKSSSV